MNRRERLAQKAGERHKPLSPPKGPELMDPNATKEIVAVLEPILLGLLNGTKKLVIDSMPYETWIEPAEAAVHVKPAIGYKHTIRVEDN